jgi:hypothetical protein
MNLRWETGLRVGCDAPVEGEIQTPTRRAICEKPQGRRLPGTGVGIYTDALAGLKQPERALLLFHGLQDAYRIDC